MRSSKCLLVALLQLFPAVVSAESPKPTMEKATIDASSPHANQLRLEIEGMSCQSCVNSITEALRATPGVEDVVVTLEPQRAEVKLKSAGAPTAEELIKVITDLGYTAKLAPL